ncbi:MAG TPA: hypothetical protein VF548_16280 [Allosphingosinicella sp.]|jgi:hypothetical protein
MPREVKPEIDGYRALARAGRNLEQACRIMAPGRPRDGSEEWLLLATLIGEADLAFREARSRDPSLELPLLEKAIEEYYDMTGGFTDPEFLRLTRAARRRNPKLFRAGL